MIQRTQLMQSNQTRKRWDSRDAQTAHNRGLNYRLLLLRSAQLSTTTS